jgi:hypothetical protein
VVIGRLVNTMILNTIPQTIVIACCERHMPAPFACGVRTYTRVIVWYDTILQFTRHATTICSIAQLMSVLYKVVYTQFTTI